jgi:hypothetical protein
MYLIDPAKAHELESEHRKKFFPAEKVFEVIESIDGLKKIWLLTLVQV